MKRDTKIVLWVASAIPVVILSASTLCAWAIAQGSSMRWRLLFRFMCHGIPERCLMLFGVPMPICARCAAIYAGMFAGLIVAALVFASHTMAWMDERSVRSFAFLAMVPMAIDGVTQLTGLRESTNPLRIATGLIAGFAFGLWILSAMERRHKPAFSTP
jgi:uncharacterized membrane protein